MLSILAKYRLRTWWLAALIVVLYNNWILSFWLNPNLNQMIATASEASAAGQPFAWLNRSLDIIGGLVILSTTYYIYRLSLTRHFKATWLLIAAYISVGLDNIIDAILRLSCAPSLDKDCSYNYHPTHLIIAHEVESFVAGLIIFVLPLMWLWLNRQATSKLLKITFWFLILQIIFGGVVVIEKIIGADLIGIVHRFYLISISAWLAGLLYMALKQPADNRKFNK